VTLILILAGLGVALWIANKLIDSLADRAQRRFDRFTDERLEQRVLRLREAARSAGRAPGSAPPARARWHAGLIDAGSALAGGLVFALLQGLTSVTEYGIDGTHSHLEEQFSLWIFLLATIAVYVAIGLGAAFRSAHNHTFGQRFGDYGPRRTDGEPLSGGDVLKRHLLRVPAAPAAMAAALSGSEPSFEHDRWTRTAPATLAVDQPLVDAADA
jgi:hypothetical protein